MIKSVTEYHSDLPSTCVTFAQPQKGVLTADIALAAMAEIDIGCNLAGLQLSCCILLLAKQEINMMRINIGLGMLGE